MYSKYKFVLMISVVFGQIIHQLIITLKERERHVPRGDILNLRIQ